jgi:hypothetical protein
MFHERTRMSLAIYHIDAGTLRRIYIYLVILVYDAGAFLEK